MTYERFTDRSRKVMMLANQEAQRLNHPYIGAEHILLGLIKEGSGVAAMTLKNLDIDLGKIRLIIEKLVECGPDMVTMGKLPQTPRAQKVLENAVEESKNLKHNYVGTEHILLGLIREEEGCAADALRACGVKMEDVREEIFNLLGHGMDKLAKEVGADQAAIIAAGKWVMGHVTIEANECIEVIRTDMPRCQMGMANPRQPHAVYKHECGKPAIACWVFHDVKEPLYLCEEHDKAMSPTTIIWPKE